LLLTLDKLTVKTTRFDLSSTEYRIEYIAERKALEASEFDAAKVGAAVAGSTRGIIGLTSDVIKETGSMTTTGLKNSASSLQGSRRISTWDEAIPERYQKTRVPVQAALAEMRYPPVTE